MRYLYEEMEAERIMENQLYGPEPVSLFGVGEVEGLEKIFRESEQMFGGIPLSFMEDDEDYPNFGLDTDTPKLDEETFGISPY